MSRRPRVNLSESPSRSLMTIAPLAPAALGLGIGVWADYELAPGIGPYLLLIGVSAIGLAVGRVRRRLAWCVAGLAAVGVGGVLHDASYRRVSSDHIARFVGDESILARVRGTVMSEPREVKPRETFFTRWVYRGRKTRLLMRVSEVSRRDEWVGASGLVSVSVEGDVFGVRAGDGVEALGRVYRYRGAMNPGQFDYALWQRRHGVHVGMSCKTADLVAVRQEGVDPWRAARGRLRRWATAMLTGADATIGEETSGLLETMVLGRRGAVDQRTEELFIRTGTTHFLAVSGAHLGIVAWFAWSVGRWLGGTRRACAGFVATLIVVYACVVDPRPPVLRAAIIGVTLCAGLMLRRSTTSVNSLALAAIVLLIARPTALFEAGFQMSFAGILAIIFLHRPLRYVLRWPVWRRSADLEDLYPVPVRPTGWRKWTLGAYHHFCSAGAVSVAACLASTPIVVSHFGRIAPLAWLWSIVVLPFVVLTLLTGVATVLLGWVTPVLWPLMRMASESSAGVLLNVVERLDDVSPDFHGVSSIVRQIVYLAIVAALAGNVRIGASTVGGTFRRRIRLPFFPVVFGLAVAVAGGRAVWGQVDRGGSLRVTHLAVGPGTAAVVEFPDGRVWLYDCGTTGSYDVGASVVVPFCRERGIDRIDRVVISHPNLDHFSGLFSLLDALPTGPVVIHDRFREMSPFGGPAEAMLAQLDRRGHPIEVFDVVAKTENPKRTTENGRARRGNVTVEALWPTGDPRGGVSSNESSLVLRLTYEGRSVLLSGDIEEEAMEGLLEIGGLGADVLVLPHHGGWEANSEAFVEAVDPSVCVASTHRTSMEIAAKLPSTRRVISSGDNGAVTIEVDSEGIRVGTFVGGFGFQLSNNGS